jgi:hypothetical protein
MKQTGQGKISNTKEAQDKTRSENGAKPLPSLAGEPNENRSAFSVNSRQQPETSKRLNTISGNERRAFQARCQSATFE